MSSFNRGDKVQIVQGAHGAEKYSWGTPQDFQRWLDREGIRTGDVFTFSHIDCAGEAHVTHDDTFNIVFVLPEFLVPWVEEEDIGGWDREEFASAVPKPETVSIVALREALDFLGIQEVFDTENIISLAQRLS